MANQTGIDYIDATTVTAFSFSSTCIKYSAYYVNIFWPNMPIWPEASKSHVRMIVSNDYQCGGGGDMRMFAPTVQTLKQNESVKENITMSHKYFANRENRE